MNDFLMKRRYIYLVYLTIIFSYFIWTNFSINIILLPITLLAKFSFFICIYKTNSDLFHDPFHIEKLAGSSIIYLGLWLSLLHKFILAHIIAICSRSIYSFTHSSLKIFIWRLFFSARIFIMDFFRIEIRYFAVWSEITDYSFSYIMD